MVLNQRLLKSGNGFLEKNGVIFDKKLNAGESFHVTPLTVHRFGAGEHDVVIVEVSTTELDDVVRLQDDYKR